MNFWEKPFWELPPDLEFPLPEVPDIQVGDIIGVRLRDDMPVQYGLVSNVGLLRGGLRLSMWVDPPVDEATEA